MLNQGTLLDNRYRIGKLLGQGGMAVVYRAHDVTLDRGVAVKVLRGQYSADEDFSRRFRQEARNAASLAHPSIAQVYDTGVHEDLQYIVMQLVDAPDLEAVLAERGPLPLGEAVQIVTEAAEALQAAHDRGIVHRDVKPGNLLLTAEGDVRIVDFGIARALADSVITSPGLVIGSLPYCSPEQILGEPVGPASDVYSLGVVLYEMVTGRRPFDGASSAAVALRRVQEDPPPPSTISAGLPEGLDELVLKALARDPQARYPSAQAMADAIRGWWRTQRRRGERVRRTGIPPEALTAIGAAAAGSAAAGSAAAGPAAAPVLSPVAAPAAAPAHVSAASSAPTVRSPRVVASAARPLVSREAPEQRRRRTLPLLLIPLAAFLFVVAAFWTVTNRLQGERPGGVLAATATPGSSAIAAAPSPSIVQPSPSATLTPSPSATPSPSPTPAPTPQPTAPPTQPPTPPPTPRPTPRATPRPTTPPVVVAPAAESPAAVVAQFYNLVEGHDFDAAAALWTRRMRAEYPPDQYIDGRFARTTQIDVRRNEVVALNARAGTAVVAVDLIEYRSVEPSPRRFVGRWDLVLTDQGWRMDEPHF